MNYGKSDIKEMDPEGGKPCKMNADIPPDTSCFSLIRPFLNKLVGASKHFRLLASKKYV